MHSPIYDDEYIKIWHTHLKEQGAWHNKIIVLLLVTAFALLMFGCGSKQEASSETGTHLNIAIQPVPGYVPLYVLRDKGWLTDALKEDAVDINFTEFESGPPENKSFAAGQQDIGVMGNVPSISGIAAGQNRSIIGISYNGEQATADQRFCCKAVEGFYKFNSNDDFYGSRNTWILCCSGTEWTVT